MSTPVSVEPPPKAHLRTDSEQERDLQAKMQMLIRLQHSANDSGAHEAAEADYYGINAAADGTLSGGGRSSGSLVAMTKRSPGGRSPFPSARESRLEGPPSRQSSDVGRGTLVFSGNLLRGAKYRQPGDNATGATVSPDKELYLLQQQHQQQQNMQKHLSPHLYSPGAAPSMSQQQHQQSLQQTPPAGQPPQQIYAGYGSVQEQGHEYHYGNPDYDNMDGDDDGVDDDDPSRPFKGRGGRGGRRRGGSAVACCCERFCCLYRPAVQLLGQENLHRSFCYGAIDGLLTGSGIASALWGLGVLGVRATWEARLATLALSVAACVADAVCMAAGHVWTSHVVTSAHAEERARERTSLEHNKAEAKGRLVDMLLARGMLKIDAMSLADTLEGYPDLFVSALVGDSLLSGTEEIDDETEDGSPQQPSPRVSASPHGGGGHSAPVGTGYLGSFASWKFPSYAQFNGEMLHEPETGAVNAAYLESHKEGLFMLVGFASFAVVPSLLWLLLPLWIATPSSPSAHHVASSSTSSPSAYTGGAARDEGATVATTQLGETVSLPSLVVFLLAVIMSCLGVWKGRFVDSNWVVFGIEATAMLLVCILTSYGLAALLAYAFGIDGAGASDASSLLNIDL